MNIDIGKKIIIPIALLFSLLLSDCAKNKIATYEDYSKYWEKAQEAYEKKKWQKAIDNYKMVILNSPGGEFADDSQYKIGNCFFNRKEYLLAISEYQQLTERYRYSPLAEKGYYKIALSYVELSPKYQKDQENTEKALRNLQEFLDVFPQSEYCPEIEEKIILLRDKLGRKMYESTVLYRKLERWDSGIIYADKMLEKYYDTKWAIWTKLEKAHCLVRKRDFERYNKLIKEIQIEKSTEDIQKKIDHLDKLYEKELEKIKKEKEKSQRRF